MGGGGPSPATESIVDRIDYSNDTATASPRGNMTLGRKRHGGVGASDNANSA